MGGKPQRDGTIFIGEVDPSRHHVILILIDFNLAIAGGQGSMKWLKNWAGNCLYFMRLLLHYILFL